NGELRLVQTTGKNYEAYLLDQARGKMEAGYTQQVFTHNDNTVLGRMALELANRYGVERIEISNATVEAHFRQMAPELTRGLDWGKEADRPAAMEIAIKDMLSGRSSKPQVIEINGMSPESYQRAIEAVSDAIHYTPKMGDVLKMADGLGAGLKASLDHFIRAAGGAEKASVGAWLQEVADAYGKATSEKVARELGCGWTQARYIFAPAIGEGLNIFGAVRGLSNEMQFQGRLVKMDLSPSDVFAQAMKRGNVRDETTSALKRVIADTGLNLNLDTINGIKDVERARFQKFLEDVESKKIDITSEGAKEQFFALFDVMMKDFLVEIDTAKAGEVARTQAGELPRTDAVTVQKGSPEYMRAMADKITKDLPGRLREFQGLADLSASWNRQTPGSLLTRMPGMPAALKQSAGWSRLPSFALLLTGGRLIVNTWQSIQSAIKTDGQQLALVKNLTQTWQNPQITALAARITELKASQPATWLETLVAEQLPAGNVTDLKGKFGAGWEQIALAENSGVAKQVMNATQVAAYKAAFGDTWFESAMQERVGLNWTLYDRVNTILEPKGVIQQLTYRIRLWSAIWHEPAQAKDAYFAALEDVSNLAPVISTVAAAPQSQAARLVYRNQELSLQNAMGYVQQRLGLAQKLAKAYGISATPQVAAFPNRQRLITTQGVALGKIATAELLSRNPLVRLNGWMMSKFENGLRVVQNATIVLPLFKLNKGWVVPTLPGTVAVGAAVLAALSLTNLLLSGLLLGITASALVQPVMAAVLSRAAPDAQARLASAATAQPFNGQGAANRTARMPLAASGMARWEHGVYTGQKQYSRMALNALSLPRAGEANRLGSTVKKIALPVLFLAGGMLLGQPFTVSSALGSISTELAVSMLKAPARSAGEVLVEYRKPAMAETAGIRPEAGWKARPGLSLVETWKQEMYGYESGDTAYNKLQAIIFRPEFGQVRLTAAPVAQHYGYMHLLAAVFSLVPKALDSVSAIEVGTEKVQSPENVVGEKSIQINVDKGSIRFLDQRFSDLLLTQAVMAVLERSIADPGNALFTDAELTTLNNKLQQSGQFKEYGERAVVEFVKQYLLDGPALNAWVGQAAAEGQEWAMVSTETGGTPRTLTLYQLVRQKFGGREFVEADLAELNQAMSELENEAVPLMAELAKQIQAEPAASRAARQTEFEERFGISYDSYQSLMKPSWMQRIMIKVVGEAQLQGDRPVETVRQFGWQLAGVGAAGVALGVVGILTTMLLPLVGAAVALTGGAVAIQGLWSVYKAQAIAFSVNPAGAVGERMQQARFESEQAPLAVQKGLNTLRLLENREFNQAVSGLKIAGTERMLSEQSRSKAVRAVLGQMVRVMESNLPQELKLQLARELTQVLGFLQFGLKVQVRQEGPAVTMTLTPEVQPQALKQDYKLGRLVQRLEGLGVSVNLEVAPVLKQPKLKLTGSAV
ncbi:MAG: hypothetical protein AB1439_12805, partial [candidate division FCPU426 bacterium]